MIRNRLLRTSVAAMLVLVGFVSGIPLAGSVPSAAAASSPKVVIIVGPVGGTTTSYRTEAEAAATEARKYTPNVVTIYSPNATWDVVKPALQGASIVINMGHGSGFPTPHSSTFQPDRQDGLGLNPVAGADDSMTKYWGEQFLAAEIALAPGAVVILGHLCYASGSSEPGYAEPTQAAAQQRVDNFAAGYLAAGAGAVIAEAYGGAAAFYVNALFTAHDTIGNIWANSFSHQGNTFAFPSVRTAGATVEMDPDTASGKYYRALTGDPALSSDAVVGASGGTPPPSPTPDTGGPVPSPTPSLTLSPSPTVTGNAGAVTATIPTTTPPAPRVNSVLWTTKSVNLRNHPTTTGKVLLVLTPGTPLRLLRVRKDPLVGTWYLVRVHSRQGWVASWLTRTTRKAPAPTTSPATGWQVARVSSFGVGGGLVGAPMACGGTLTNTVMAVANLTLPCGTRVRLRHNGQVVEAQVLDRGPYVDGLTFDLAPAVCQALGDCSTLTLDWQVVQ